MIVFFLYILTSLHYFFDALCLYILRLLKKCTCHAACSFPSSIHVWEYEFIRKDICGNNFHPYLWSHAPATFIESYLLIHFFSTCDIYFCKDDFITLQHFTCVATEVSFLYVLPVGNYIFKYGFIHGMAKCNIRP